CRSMCLFPGAINTCPRSTESPSAASRTSTSQRPLSRRANASVNFSGICWTMTMPGLSAGSDSSTTRSDSVPPVEAPMQMMRSVVRAIACELTAGGGSIASAVSFFCTVRWREPFDRAGFQRLHQRLGTFLGQRRAHDHGDRSLAHNLAEKGDAVHARHLDV